MKNCMKTSIIIPAYKEENRIRRTLEAYCLYFDDLKKKHILDYELLVVINGPKDNTANIVQKMQHSWPTIKLLELEQAGKGLAIAAGFKDALTRESDVIGFVDADMATAPHYFYDLIKNIEHHDGMIASRYMRGAEVFPPRPFIKYWGRRLIYDKLVYLLFGMNYHDFQCGAKVFKRSAIEAIVPYFSVKQWAFDVELLYLNKKHGFKVKEMPTVWHDQADSKLHMMRSGIRMLGSVVKLRIKHSRFKNLVSTDL